MNVWVNGHHCYPLESEYGSIFWTAFKIFLTLYFIFSYSLGTRLTLVANLSFEIHRWVSSLNGQQISGKPADNLVTYYCNYLFPAPHMSGLSSLHCLHLKEGAPVFSAIGPTGESRHKKSKVLRKAAPAQTTGRGTGDHELFPFHG